MLWRWMHELRSEMFSLRRSHRRHSGLAQDGLGPYADSSHSPLFCIPHVEIERASFIIRIPFPRSRIINSSLEHPTFDPGSSD